jgi:hypothetical protein
LPQHPPAQPHPARLLPKLAEPGGSHRRGRSTSSSSSSSSGSSSMRRIAAVACWRCRYPGRRLFAQTP